jgi:hypothetical protein
MTDHYLVLYPKNPAWAPIDPAALPDTLMAIGFLGPRRSRGLYSAGREYLSLVTYLGCSPQVALGENEAATTIRISGIHAAPQFVHGGNLKPPRCPQCRKALDKQLALTGMDDKLRCPQCGYSGASHAFDWRRSAAFGRIFIEISNVFESEAVPGEMLIACLKQASGEAWDYAYVSKTG